VLCDNLIIIGAALIKDWAHQHIAEYNIMAPSTAPKPISHGIAKNNAPGKGWGSAKMQIKRQTACGKDSGWNGICKNPFCSVCCKEASTEFQLSLMMNHI
jgi:hypothetical protein